MKLKSYGKNNSLYLIVFLMKTENNNDDLTLFDFYKKV